MKKSVMMLSLMVILVAVLFFAGVNGIVRDHSYGPLFIFIGVCTAAGLAMDVSKLIRDRIRKANLKKLRP